MRFHVCDHVEAFYYLCFVMSPATFARVLGRPASASAQDTVDCVISAMSLKDQDPDDKDQLCFRSGVGMRRDDDEDVSCLAPRKKPCLKLQRTTSIVMQQKAQADTASEQHGVDGTGSIKDIISLPSDLSEKACVEEGLSQVSSTSAAPSSTFAMFSQDSGMSVSPIRYTALRMDMSSIPGSQEDPLEMNVSGGGAAGW